MSDDLRITEEQIKSLVAERTAYEEDEVAQARRLLRENLVPAVYSIVQISQHSGSDRLRMQASQYIVERNLGRIADTAPVDPADPFKDFLAECVRDFESACEPEQSPRAPGGSCGPQTSP